MWSHSGGLAGVSSRTSALEQTDLVCQRDQQLDLRRIFWGLKSSGHNRSTATMCGEGPVQFPLACADSATATYPHITLSCGAAGRYGPRPGPENRSDLPSALRRATSFAPRFAPLCAALCNRSDLPLRRANILSFKLRYAPGPGPENRFSETFFRVRGIRDGMRSRSPQVKKTSGIFRDLGRT